MRHICNPVPSVSSRADSLSYKSDKYSVRGPVHMAPGVAPECCGPAWRLPSGAWVPSPLCSQQVHLGSVVQQEGCLLQDKGRGGAGTPRGSAAEGAPACPCPRLPVWSPLALGPQPQPAVGQPVSPALRQTLGSCLSVSCSREGPWLEGCLPIAVAPPSPGCQSL